MVKSMRIAISTIIDYENYGNRLQNYALQEVLKSFGNDVITIKNISGTPHKNILKRILFSVLGDNSKITLFLKKSFSLFSHDKKLKVNRTINFLNFTNKNIQESQFKIDQETTNFDFDADLDCYVIGSDQVWNYSFPRFSSLDFVEYSKKPKISYAASFGVSKIPARLVSVYESGLQSVDYISTREYSGEKIVSQLTNRDSEVVLDPTLLLSKDRWLKVASDSKYSDKFIIAYFLDDISDDDMRYINNFANERNYKVKRLLSMDDEELWESGPDEFINLFSQAEAVFTDSFHAVAFSIIFNKYFEVFERNFKGPSMNSRIDTLLDDLDLADRWHSKSGNAKSIDYAKTMELLDIRKKESLSFLENSLKGVESQING